MSTGRSISFGDLLRRFRLAAGLTQEELAARAGLSRRGITDLERGARTTPRRETLDLLATALGLAGDDLTVFVATARHARVAPAAAPRTPPGTPPTPLDPQRTPRHNLPVQPTPLLGRAEQVAALTALLRHEDVRLVTLTGSGGIGKTRLAVQVAADLVDAFADGVWLVHLARLIDPALLLPTMAQTLGLKEAGRLPLEAALREHLSARQTLLVLDNFEQLVTAAPALSRLLAACPGLKALVTSRIPLHLRGEKTYTLAPLSLPPPPTPGAAQTPERLAQAAAVALFLARARDARADFTLTAENAAAIAALCTQLDGVPLALELAAARVRVLPPEALLARLASQRSSQLTLLSGGARDTEERQHTMRKTLAWSYDLLAPAVQVLFRRLAVFVGGCTLEAAEAVCSAPEATEPLHIDVLEGLSMLVEESLVQQREEDGEARFGMLHVIREYALERLEANDQGHEKMALRRAHAAYMTALAERAEPELAGPEKVSWLACLEREHDNLRAALAWARAHPRTETELGLRLAAALEAFWFSRGYLSEGRGWTEEFLVAATPNQAGAAEEIPAGVWARALKTAGWLALFGGGDFGTTASWLEAAVATARAAGDLRTVAAASNGLGAVAYFQGDLAQAAARLEESLPLFRTAGNIRDVAYTLSRLGEVALHQGDLARAAAFSEEALTLCRRAGELDSEVNTLCVLGQLARQHGDLTTAMTLQQQGLTLARALGDPFRTAETLEYLVAVVGTEGQGEQAARLLGAAAALRESIGTPQPPPEGASVETAVAAARATLGEEAWAAAFAAGRALSVEEAIAEALGNKSRDV
jgi:predicted ATPase/transcriptional regulator with XRE-family HTH domain